MEPPRRRRPKVTRSLARLSIATILNLGAALLTILIVRAVGAAAGANEDLALQRLADNLTKPVVWPFLHLPGMQAQIIGRMNPADLLAIVAVGLVAIMAVGVIAGWEAEGRR